jgi:hypothetical protein
MLLNQIKWASVAGILGVILHSAIGDPIQGLNRLVTTDVNQLFKSPDAVGSVAIGVAEGTRHRDGRKTEAYDGHKDPGNDKANLGTFSWQHGAPSPEEADRRQLAVLKDQTAQIKRDAEKKGVSLSSEELLNAADLANQAPAAAIGDGGFADRLKQCKSSGKQGEEAILCARVESYRRPSTGEFDAPGLGGEAAIKTDQARRMGAIDSVIKPKK